MFHNHLFLVYEIENNKNGYPRNQLRSPLRLQLHTYRPFLDISIAV